MHRLYAGSVQDFTRLRVWEASVHLAERIYEVTDTFPSSERFGMVMQMRRAAVSVSSNIAEGVGRRGGPDTSRFLQIAIGSASEIESQVRVAHRLGMLDNEEGLLGDVISVRRQLIRLQEKVEAGS
jgi:four helix bundle protein